MDVPTALNEFHELLDLLLELPDESRAPILAHAFECMALLQNMAREAGTKADE